MANTFNLDLALAKRNEEVLIEVLVGHGEGLTIEEFVLQKDDGVVVTDGGLEIARGARRIP